MKVGIDLGTTYSVIAKYDSGTSRTEVVHNKYSKDLTPSVICFMDDGSVHVGEDAKDFQKGGMGTIAAAFKVNMGTSEPCLRVGDKAYNAQELSTILLKEIISEAEANTGEKIDSAVITVPAYFDDTRRKATKAAAEAAGVKVSKIINEPTAAAIYYGYKRSEGRTVLVYDLGGGTFDVTIVKVSQGSIEVVGTKGNHNLGGKDWDEALLNICCEKFFDEFGIDPREDNKKTFELLADVEDYKKILGRTKEVPVTINFNGHTGRYIVTREEFEVATKYLVEATSETLDKLLADLKLGTQDIDEVLLVGGSTRLTQVNSFLQRYGFKNIVEHRDTDLAVAKGAALVASFFSEGSTPSFSVVDVTAHSLGALSIDPDTGRYYNDILIPVNTQIPARVTKSFRIEEGNLTDQLEIYVLQGESPFPADCSVVRRVIVTGFENIGKSMIIDVTYAYDDEGVVNITATRNGNELTVIEESVPDDVEWMSGSPKERTSNKRVTKSIVLCVDLSRSMKLQMEEVKAAIRSFVASLSGEFTKFALIGFGDKAKVLCELTDDDEEVLEVIENLKVNSLGRGTDASPLELAKEVLENEKGARTVLILTDGIWGKRDNAVAEARSCKEEMIDIVAVGFGDADRSFLKQIATLEEGAMYVSLKNLGKTINTIATAIKASPTGLMEKLR